MTNQFPDATKMVPLPPPELVRQWLGEQYGRATVPAEATIHVATQAAQWGADQELEACVDVLGGQWEWDVLSQCTGWKEFRDQSEEILRAARRPKPPSLKEQALAELKILRGDANAHGLGFDAPNIRRALEALPND
jgi:phosphopentomutase